MAKTGIDSVEESLNEVFGKKAPQLPEGGRNFLVQYGPYFVLAGGILSLLGAWSLWNSARQVNQIVNWANQYSTVNGGPAMSTTHFTVWVWLAIAVLLVESALYILAFSPLKARDKKGWDYLFYAALLSIAYSVVLLFVDGYGIGGFLGSLIGAAIGFWILFQVRPKYLKDAGAKPAKK